MHIAALQKKKCREFVVDISVERVGVKFSDLIQPRLQVKCIDAHRS